MMLLIAPGLVRGQMSGFPSFDQSIAKASFESLDLNPLRPWARLRIPDVSDDELDRRLSANIRFIFHNMLNRRHFIVAPEPETVVVQIAEILRLVQELNGLVGPRRTVAGERVRDRRLVEEVRRLARELHGEFTDYFTEGQSSSFEINLRVSRNPTAQLSFFMSASRKITRELTTRTDNFFLSSAPGAVSLEQYRSSSIGVLSAALERLAGEIAKRLEAAEAADDR